MIQQGVEGKALPEGWRWVKLGDVVENIQPGFACGERDVNGIIQLRMNNVNTSGSIDLNEHIRIPKSFFKGEKYLLKPNDVLFNNTNSVELVGKSALFCGYDEPVVYSNHFTRLRPNPEILMAPFLVFWLVQQWQFGIFQELCNRWVGQSAVNGSKLLNLTIPLPPIAEQKRIVEILNDRFSAIETARQATQTQLEAAKALPAAYLRQVFNSAEAQGWEKRSLGDVASFKNGINFTSDQKGEGIPTVDVLNMYSDDLFIRISDLYRVHIKCQEDYLLQTNDILFVRSSVKREGVGWTSLCPILLEPTTFCGFIIRARITIDDLLPEFLTYYCRANFVREELISKSGTGTITNISQTQLRTLNIPLPPIAEQKRIVEILNDHFSAIETARQALEEQLEAINALPAALLRQAFNGEL